jgi:hypothetical protein
MRVDDPGMCNADAENTEPWVQTGSSGLPLTLQALIDALIDIDLTYERECKELSNSRPGATLQYHQLEELRVQHRERREPYVQQLIALQGGLRTRNGFPGMNGRSTVYAEEA